MGIEGAAIATGIGQVIPLIVYLFIFIKHPVSLHFHWHEKVFQKRLMGQMYGVGIPATLNLALPSFMITALNGILAVYSASYVLVLGIYYKLQTFIYLSANGIVQGIRPIISYNYGAGERACQKNFYYCINYDCFHYVCWYVDMSGICRKSDRTVYKKFAYDFGWRTGGTHYLYGLCDIGSFGYDKWYVRGIGERCGIFDSFAASLCCRNYTGGICAWKTIWRCSSLALLLDCGDDCIAYSGFLNLQAKPFYSNM